MSSAVKIKRRIFRSILLSSCTPFARFLFIGLKMLGGSGRRVEENYRDIKAELLPYDDENDSAKVRSLVDELVEAGAIFRRLENDRAYLVIGSLGKRKG